MFRHFYQVEVSHGLCLHPLRCVHEQDGALASSEGARHLADEKYERMYMKGGYTHNEEEMKRVDVAPTEINSLFSIFAPRLKQIFAGHKGKK